ncbi:GPW/gp25 family protein [Bacterioplanoides sp.]|uniref:GPW/gp25 family protein n=1 Tax=Bacterioplanoides sp. TaxID=2066072 RepID=UPI003B008D14
MAELNDPQHLSFPFRIRRGGPVTSGRQRHVREQIEQVLFTNVRERIFRPEFGAGVKQLIFEPNNQVLRDTLRQRLMQSLGDALLGEVDPRTLEIGFAADQAVLKVLIAYQLATINRRESHEFDLSTDGAA